ncbi:MAG: M13 family metallopeptidase [Bacteroidales bacterium]|nr:M13 family metallopeptidase [Bacteroidales bacterium]
MKQTLLAIMTLSLFAATSCNKGSELSSGVNLDNLDTTFDPAEDFYHYACGGWLKAHPLDAEHSRYGAFDVLAETNQEQLRTLIDSLVNTQNAAGSYGDKIATLYKVGMDTATIEQQGVEPIKPYLEEIAALKTTAESQAEMRRLHGIGINPFFAMFNEADASDANMCIAWFYQTGIGMGERDYYLESKGREPELRKAYIKLMETQFANAGYDKMSGKTPVQLAKMVMDFETRLAKAQYDNETNRDPFKTNNKMTLDTANIKAPGIDYKAYFTEIGLPELTSFNMCQPEYFQEVGKALNETKSLEAVKAYYAWNVINSAASYLSSNFVNANFEFYGRTLSGAEQIRPRWKRVTNTVDGAMGEALGQLYVERYFPAAAKHRMVEMVNNLKEAFAMRIHDAQWMSEGTKQRAIEKLSTIMVKVGYPDKWRDYSGLEIKNDSYFANVIRSNQFDIAYMVSKIDKPVDKTEWGMTPQTVNAYYNPTTNEICFPAGILQKPFFDMNADDAFNYGAIGVVIGHEMTHGFDDQGRHYDKNGNLNDWWEAEDTARFQKNAQVLVDWFNKVKISDDPEVYANGKLTLGENIADNGGLHISYQALQNALKKRQVNEKKMDGFTPAQRFFLAYAGVWASNIREEMKLQLTAADVHSLAENRVNATLPHVTEFLEAFGIQPGCAMYLAPELRAQLW